MYLHTIELDSLGFNELVESYDHNSAPYILHSYSCIIHIYIYACRHTHVYIYVYMHDRWLHGSDIHECNVS